jgi:adenylylsulfate kinase
MIAGNRPPTGEPHATVAQGNPSEVSEVSEASEAPEVPVLTESTPTRSSAPQGAIVWFTGLPSSGKTTLARRVQARFAEAGRVSVLLDGDELRDLLGAHAYGPGDRDRFYRSLAALAGLLANQGVVVLVAATAPRRADRDRAREEVGAGRPAKGRFVEVWVETPLAECEARDPKGLYAAARRGEARELPGVGVAYESPVSPEVIADGGFDDRAVAAIEARLGPPAPPRG